MQKRSGIAMLIAGAALAAACGGSGGSHVTATPSPPPTSATSPILSSGSGRDDSFYSVYFVDDKTGWVSGTLNGEAIILATTDGGKSWLEQYPNASTALSPNPAGLPKAPPIDPLQFVSPSVGWTVARSTSGRDEPSILLRTVDGGNHWKLIYKIVGSVHIDLITASTGRLVDSQRGLVETTDGGMTWAAVPTSIKMSSICFGDADRGWAIANGEVVRTTDGGRTWGKGFAAPADLKGGPTGEGVSLRSLLCKGQNTAWALFLGGVASSQEGFVVYRTVDGGTSWKPVLANGFPQLHVAQGNAAPGPLSLVDAHTAFAAGSCPACHGIGTTSIQSTSDGGLSWRTAAIPQLNEISAIAFADAEHGWAVGKHFDEIGTQLLQQVAIVATTDGGNTWTQQYP